MKKISLKILNLFFKKFICFCKFSPVVENIDYPEETAEGTNDEWGIEWITVPEGEAKDELIWILVKLR